MMLQGLAVVTGLPAIEPLQFDGGAGWYWSLPKIAPKTPNLSNSGDWTPSASSVDTFDGVGMPDEC